MTLHQTADNIRGHPNNNGWIYDREDLIARCRRIGFIRSTDHDSTAGLGWPAGVLDGLWGHYKTDTNSKNMNTEPDNTDSGTLTDISPVLAVTYPLP